MSLKPGRREVTIPTFDISDETDRQVVIAQGTSDKRWGHPTTLLMPDGRTMFVTWSHGHGGPLGPIKKSEDGGLSWSEQLDVPENWAEHANCPSLYRLPDPQGNYRLFIFASRGPGGKIMYRSISEDGGATWSPFRPSPEGKRPAPSVMPFTAIMPVEGGEKLLGVSNIRRPGEGGRTNVIAQTKSEDGGDSWGDWKIVLDLGDPFRPCEPDLIRAPAGDQLLMIIRENERSFNSWIMLSDDEGRSWQEPFQAVASVTFDRHKHCYTEDGRLVITGRDRGANSPSKDHFVAWVGTYEDLVEGREGDYRVKLLHTHDGAADYGDLELLPDGTFVGTSSVRYRPGEQHSVVNTRFTLKEFDERVSKT